MKLDVRAAAKAAAVFAIAVSASAQAALTDFKVNGEEVTAVEQKAVYDALVAQGMPAGQQTETRAKAIVLQRKVLALAAEDEKIDQRDEVKLQIAASREQILGNALIEEYRKAAKITDQQVRDRYEAEKKLYGDMEYRVSRIAVQDKKAAEDIIKQLAKNPKDFAKIAREQSIDKQTSAKGGEIGWIVPAQVGQGFASSFIYLTPGSVAQVPIPTGNAWSVVMLNETRKAQNFPKFESQKNVIKAQLEREAAQAKIRDLLQKAKIEED